MDQSRSAITMPRFFFDIDDGRQRFSDDEGGDFADPDEAHKELIGSLALIAKDALPNGNNRDFAGNVRDATGKVVFEAKLFLRSGWVR